MECTELTQKGFHNSNRPKDPALRIKVGCNIQQNSTAGTHAPKDGATVANPTQLFYSCFKGVKLQTRKHISSWELKYDQLTNTFHKFDT